MGFKQTAWDLITAMSVASCFKLIKKTGIQIPKASVDEGSILAAGRYQPWGGTRSDGVRYLRLGGGVLYEIIRCWGGFLGGASGKEPTCQCRRHKRGQLDPWVRKIHFLEEDMATHSNILAWRIPWAEEPVGYSLWGHKELGMAKATKYTAHKTPHFSDTFSPSW